MSPVGNFWSGLNGGTGVLSHTSTGHNQLPDPTRIPGSSIGAVPSAYVTSAREVYPTYDGVTKIDDVVQTLAFNPATGFVDYRRYPESFWTNSDELVALENQIADGTVDRDDVTFNPNLNLAPADFTDWHSSFQAEYIVLQSGSTVPPSYTIGTGTPPAAIYMLDDKNRPVNLMSLTLSDYAKLTDAERLRFNDKLVSSGHLNTLGLKTGATVIAAFIGAKTPDPGTGLSANLVTIDNSSLTDAQKQLFTIQIQMLIDEVQGAFAFNSEKVSAAAKTIMDRLDVVDKFVSAPRPLELTVRSEIDQERTPGTGPDFHESAVSSSTLTKTKVNSLDDGKMMDAGIDELIRAETEIVSMKMRRSLIVQDTAYRDPNMDVPNLIYQLQLLYEGESKGVVDAGTEIFRQLHKLLEDYNVMQQLLSTTISYFDTGESDEKRRFMNIGAKDDGSVEERQVNKGPLAGQENTYSESYSYPNVATAPYALDSTPTAHWSLLAIDDPVAAYHRRYNDEIKDQPDINNLKFEGDVEGKLTPTEMIAFSMFADEYWTNTDDRWHPVEELYGAPRPELDLVDESEEGGFSLQLYSKNSFDQFQTAMSNTITILNQQNQIKQNEIENATKQQNRHFELGNNALRKMNDMLLMIGRM